MRQLQQDLRFGVRTLARTPGFTLVAILVLALGIGANSAMFTLVNALLFRPLAGKANDLVGLYSRDRTKPDTYRGFSYPNYVDIRAGNDVFESLMAHWVAMVGVPAGEGTRQTFVEIVSSNYFEALGVPLAAGRSFTPEEERPDARLPVVIVAHDRAALLGQTIKINTIDFAVVGVAPRGFTGTMALLTPEMWLPLGTYDTVVNDLFKARAATGLADRRAQALILAGRLKPGVSLLAAAARLETLSRQFERAYPAENKDQALTINRLPRIGISTAPRTDTALHGAAAMLTALAGVVLLIACLNIANMLLARGAARRKEIAIRLALGGGRGRIIRQLLTEGLILSVAGAAGGLLIASWTTGALVASLSSVMPLAIAFDPRPDARVLAVTTIFAVLATALSGLGPAFTLSRANLVTDLTQLATDGGGGRSRRRLTARNVLVVGQIALSLMLLTAGGLFVHGALKASAANPGFSYSQELLVLVDPGLVQYDEPHGRASHEAVLERLRALPGIEAAGLASSVPFGDFEESHSIARLGAAAGVRPTEATYRIVGADYFRALGLRVKQGREFSAAEERSSTSPRVAIIDQALARRLFGPDNPVGQMIRVAPDAADTAPPGDPLEVIGVAPPVRDQIFDQDAQPSIYVPSGRTYRSQAFIHVRTARPGSEADVLSTIRRELRALDPRLPVLQATTMEAFHHRSVDLWAITAGGRMFLALGLLALVLAVVGLYGVKAYLVAQRTREIGVRMALGARERDVLVMVLAEGAGLSAAGIAIGLPLAALLGYGLSSVLYDIRPLDPVVFLGAPLVLALSALAATWVPARRATRVNPLTALRAD